MYVSRQLCWALISKEDQNYFHFFHRERYLGINFGQLQDKNKLVAINLFSSHFFCKGIHKDLTDNITDIYIWPVLSWVIIKEVMEKK